MNRSMERSLSDLRFYAQSLVVTAVVLATLGEEQNAVFAAIMSACYGLLWAVARREEKP